MLLCPDHKTFYLKKPFTDLQKWEGHGLIIGITTPLIEDHGPISGMTKLIKSSTLGAFWLGASAIT